MDVGEGGEIAPPQVEQQPIKILTPVFEPQHMSMIDDGVLASATVRMYAR